MSSKLSILATIAAMGLTALPSSFNDDYGKKYVTPKPNNNKRKNKRKLSKQARRNNR